MKTLVKNLTLAIGLCLVAPATLIAQSWTLPKDNQGWSILTPSTDSRIIYVSNSSGNDATAQIYSIADVGNNPQLPGISVNAYQTLSEALGALRDGYPDWVLIKRGDHFEHENISINNIGSGRNPNERMVLTCYGESGARPAFENSTLISFQNVTANNWAFVGLNFYCSALDPNAPAYNDPEHGELSFLSGGSYILFEDCVFNFYELVIQAFDGPFQNIEIRRNISTNQYAPTSCSTGARSSSFFISGTTNYLIEENVSDHAGWNAEIPDAGRNQFNHGFYLQNDNQGDLYFRGNIISRASANAVQNRSGGLCENNLSIQCPTGIFVAHDDTHGAPAATAGLTASLNNVVIEGLWMGDCPNSSGANWGMPLDVNLEAGTLIQGNIVAHNIDKRGSNEAIQQIPHCNYVGNIVYDWNDAEDMWDDSWPDPERSIGSYNQTIGSNGTTEAFIEACISREVHEWPEEISAYPVINYIREGFGLSASTVVTSIEDVSSETPLYQNYPNPFKLSTTIKYTVSPGDHVRLNVFDLSGKEVKTLVDTFQDDGNYEVEFSAENLKPGIYYYQLSFGNTSTGAKKMVCIK